MIRGRLFAAATFVALVLTALVAPAAMAADGVGLWGRTTDKDVTFWGFGVIALFIVLPIVLSLLQGRIENRKEQHREQLERINRP